MAEISLAVVSCLSLENDLTQFFSHFDQSELELNEPTV
jgi:hypothetical protein